MTEPPPLEALPDPFMGGVAVLWLLLAVPLALEWIITLTAVVFTALGLAGGAAYGLIVFGTGGHVDGVRHRAAKHLEDWRLRWLSLAAGGYMVGLVTVAVITTPGTGVVVACCAALVIGFAGVALCLDGQPVGAAVEWFVPAAMAAMLFMIAVYSRVDLTGWAFSGFPALERAVPVLWAAGAMLTAFEVRAVAVAVRRGRGLLPAG